MALFQYDCKACSARFSVMKRRSDQACTKCGSADVERAHEPPGATAYERIDNGLMVKAVERMADVERMSSERARGKKGIV